MSEAVDPSLFPIHGLSADLVSDLRFMNPWWERKKMKRLPETRRFLVDAIHRRLERNLAPIVLVRGPRRIGKTIAHEQVISDLLARGVAPNRVFRVQFDELESLKSLRSEKILRLVEWYAATILDSTLNEAAHAGRPAFLFFDEVQNLKAWDAQLKSLVDHSTVQAVVTGSSALRLEMGRDSLAGRISTIDCGVLSLNEIARFHGVDLGGPMLSDNGLEPLNERDFWIELTRRGAKHAESRDRAFRWFSERGGYPIGHDRPDVGWTHLAGELRDTVIKRVIKHDLRVGERGRKRDEALLEELFRLACRYVGQSPGPATLAREVQRALQANVGVQRVTSYLRFLANTMLLHVVPPLELRLKKKKGHSKICLADHALRASWLQEAIPLVPDELAREPHLSDLARRIAESIAGTLLSTISALNVAHLPARPDQPEVDYVITIGTRRIPVEVKYQKKIDPLRDTEGLRTFIEKAANNSAFGLLVVQTDEARLDDPRIVTMPLSTFLMLK